jgi:hypothetical protein
MKTYSYDVSINLQGTEPILFLNKELCEPGVDYIIDRKSMFEGVSLVFKHILKQNDFLMIYSKELRDIYFFRVEEEGDGKVILIDESCDTSKGLYRYTEWMK